MEGVHIRISEPYAVKEEGFGLRFIVSCKLLWSRVILQEMINTITNTNPVLYVTQTRDSINLTATDKVEWGISVIHIELFPGQTGHYAT
jgi:hypothetical protein